MKNAGLFFGVEPLLKFRPKHAALLAGISNAWASVELLLAELFGYLVAARYFTTRAGWSQDPISNELWDSFHLIGQRLDLIRAALHTRVDDDGLKAQFKELCDKIRDTAGSRNTYVHAAWAVSSAYPKHIIRTKMRGFDQANEHPTSIEELWVAIEKIDQTRVAVHDFYLAVQVNIIANLPEEPPPALTGETLVISTPIDTPVVFDPPIFDQLRIE